MWRTIILLFLIFLPSFAHALTFTEVAYDIEGRDDKREWVELFNESQESMDLASYLFFDGSYHKLNFDGSSALPAGQRLILADDRTIFQAEHAQCNAMVVDTIMSLPNYQADGQTPTHLAIVDSNRQPITELDYLPTKGGSTGHTWELKNDTDWQDSVNPGGTPCRPYEATDPSLPPPPVKLSEIMNNPVGADTGQEWVELSCLAAVSTDLNGWSLVRLNPNGEVQGHQRLDQGFTFNTQGFLVASLSSQLTLINSEFILQLTSPDGSVVDTVTVPASEKEGLSWAHVNDQWGWTADPTPGQSNQLVQPKPSASPRLKSSSTQLSVSPTAKKQSPKPSSAVSSPINSTSKLALTRLPVHSSSPSPHRAAGSVATLPGRSTPTNRASPAREALDIHFSAIPTPTVFAAGPDNNKAYILVLALAFLGSVLAGGWLAVARYRKYLLEKEYIR